MFLNLPILLTGISANLILGLIVLIRNRRSATNILFFLLSLDIILWSIANTIALSSKDLLMALVWTRIVMALAVPQAVIFFFLIATIPEKRITLRSWVVMTLITVATVTSLICLSPYLFPSIIFINNSPSPTPGPAMPIFILVAVGSVLAGIITLIRKLRNARTVVKRQLQIVGVGIVVMFALIVFFNFILVIFFEVSSYISFSPLYTLPFVGATAYAIVRHKFLDIRAVIARAVSYAVIISLFGLLYALLFSLSSTLLVTPFVDYRIVAISTVAAILMLTTFPVVKRLVEKATDAVFYKDKYDSAAVLYRLTGVLARSLRLEDVTHAFLRGLNQELHITQSCIVMIDKDHIFATITEGYEKTPELPESLAIDITKTGKILNRDEISLEAHNVFFDELGLQMIYPLKTSEHSIGFLGVGDKLSGDLYNQNDRDVLGVISPEAAVAIENSLSYEEIRRFNKTLEEEIEKATSDLQQANVKLKELDKLKDEFVSLASHELRTPMTAIRSYIWMAKSDKGIQVSQKQRYYLDRAFTSTNRLIKLVNDMLNISRIESGRLSVIFDRVDIVAIIKEVIDEVKPTIESSGLTISVNEKDTIPQVIADSDKVKEVLINFIGNSMKFTPRNGKITVSISDDDHFVRVTVTDTGIGIASENISKLFRKFSTVLPSSTTDTSIYQSTGLGLYISKSIIELHGGAVRADSEGVGKGSTFQFTLPIYTHERLNELQKKYPNEGLGIIHSVIGENV